LCAIGKLAFHGCDGFPNVGRGFVHVLAIGEANRHLADAFKTICLDRLDPIDFCYGRFHWLGDVAFDVVRAHPGTDGEHSNRRQADVGEHLLPNLRQGGQTEGEQTEEDHEHGNGPVDREPSDTHLGP